MTALESIALKNLKHRRVKDWHKSLTKVIPDETVYHIFLNAVKEGDTIFFRDREELTRAERFSDDVRKVFPTAKLVSM